MVGWCCPETPMPAEGAITVPDAGVPAHWPSSPPFPSHPQLATRSTVQKICSSTLVASNLCYT